ncbi:hypothetical protein ACFQY5_11005 [Paeniroseomonas aquatica]|uniref:hypothetical protein n=1 Tax=Paeniroseomonas aquatica TaxID=373043 RepID=UPI0036078282
MTTRRLLLTTPALLLPGTARAEFPDKPLTMVVAFAAGAGPTWPPAPWPVTWKRTWASPWWW